MNFDHSEERQMLADQLQRYLAQRYPMDVRNAVAYSAPFHDAARWGELAELGIIAALVPEADGGFGGTGFDIITVFEALGSRLCPEPFLAGLMASRLLGAVGADQSGLIDGTTRYAVAASEIDASGALAGIRTTARKTPEGYALTGRKSSIYGGQSADVFLVFALIEDTPALFRVERPDHRVSGYGTIDGGGAAELLLQDTAARLLMEDAEPAFAAAMRAGRLALCAEAVGAMDALHALLLDYLKTRKQFGKPIGSFQVLQHRAVDLLIEIEQARSITIAAASALDSEGGALKVAMAKHLIGKTGRLVAEEAIQMHGGIAMTWEYAASHYAKRLIMLDHQLGDTDHCLETVMSSYVN